MTENEEGVNELVVLMKVLDILKISIESRGPSNYESVQIRQVTNQFLPGTTIGNFISLDQTTIEGDGVMGDKYEAHGQAQVGAMGKNANVESVVFENRAQTADSELDLKALAKELEILRGSMRSEATSTEDDQAIVAVGQAISSADKGDKVGTLEHLKNAGKWAAGLATAIGAGVAAAAIKSALGL